MYYCLIDFLALLVLLITNHDVLLNRADDDDQKVQMSYRNFLYIVIAYYITDCAWAWLYELQELDWLYVDTEVYFIVMAAGVLFWLYYVVKYLGAKGWIRKFLTYAGLILFVGVALATLLNRLYQVMFYFDASGTYQTGYARDIIFIYQVILLLVISLYTLVFATVRTEKQRKRHIIIGLTGLIIMVFIAVQVFFPTYPLYAISYMMGCCLLRTFVIENEREEYRQNLEIALGREREQFQQLNAVWDLAYTDALTGVKSKLAYAEKALELEKQLDKGMIKELAIAVFDVNGLKQVNDNLGHDAGDEYIRKACRYICDIFSHSPVYRVGGDEFVVILERGDYQNREMLCKRFNQQMEENRQNNDVVVAMGMSVYDPAQDVGYKRIYKRADALMYERKLALKA